MLCDICIYLLFLTLFAIYSICGEAYYQLILVGCDSDENCLWKDERLVMLFNVADKRLRVTLQYKPHSRLVLVHRIQDDLQQCTHR